MNLPAQYVKENNIHALCELILKGYSEELREDMMKYGLTYNDATTVLAVLSIVNTHPNLDRASSETQESMDKILSRIK